MKIEQLQRELKNAQQRHRELPAQTERLKAQIAGLRSRRTELLAKAGLGDEGAASELRRTEQAIADALRQERLVSETTTELQYACRKMQTQLLRAIISEELAQLPKIESTLVSALKPVGKAIAGIDCDGIDSCTRQFTVPGASMFQNAGALIRSEIAKALASAVASLSAQPEAAPRVSLASLDRIYQEALSACDVEDSAHEKRLVRARQNHEIERRKLEAGTAL